MGVKKYNGSTFRPRSVLASLHEPLLDPKDGHGARSWRDVMILQKWEAARKGDDQALIDLVKHIVDENLAELKAAKTGKRVARFGPGKSAKPGTRSGDPQMKIRSLVPVMSLLRMISVETVTVTSERDGFAEVTRRQKIRFDAWFKEYALGRAGLDPKIVEGVQDWIDRGAIQRPYRGECQD